MLRLNIVVYTLWDYLVIFVVLNAERIDSIDAKYFSIEQMNSRLFGEASVCQSTTHDRGHA